MRRLSHLAFIALLAAVFAHAATVCAQSNTPDAPREDVVELRDGTTLRGQIAERRADGSMVIVLATGEVRSLAAGDVGAVRLAQEITPRAPAPAVESTARVEAPTDDGATARDDDDAIATLRPAPGRVPVAFESTGAPLEIGLNLGSTETRDYRVRIITHYHSTLCRTPCVLYVRRGSFPLWSGGEEVWPYETTLTVLRAGMRVRLYAAGVARGGGVLASILGAFFTVPGAIMLPVGVITRGGGPGDAFIIAGSVLLGLGVPALVTGIVLIATNPVGIADISLPPRRATRARTPWRVTVAPLIGGAQVLFATPL